MIGDTRFIGYCAVFKVRGEASAFKSHPWLSQADKTGEGRSLKTQQHVCDPIRAELVSVTRPGFGRRTSSDRQAIRRLREKPSLERR